MPDDTASHDTAPHTPDWLDSALARFDEDPALSLDESLSRLFTLMKIRSVSTDPANAVDCERAAEHLAAEAGKLGFAAEVIATPGHPVMIARRGSQRAGAPRILFYGHYDVQPVYPPEDWDLFPFNAQIVGDAIYGRGASDDKGQMMTFLEALRAIHEETGDLPFDVTLVIEGEEEIGSPNLEAVMRAQLAGEHFDAVLACDSPMWDEDTPAINVRLRGMMAEEVILRTPHEQVHSGLHGGPARNAATELSALLAGLHDAQGRVDLPGFYDGLAPVPDEIRASLEAVQFDAGAYLAGLGQSESAGEAGASVLEQTWLRPTCDIVGMSAGYTGPGLSSMVPSEARAKLSFRLVAGQTPAGVRALLHEALAARTGPDVTLDFAPLGDAMPVAIDTGAPEMAVARAALEAEWGRAPVLNGVGGSLPVAALFPEICGRDVLLVGFALPSDNIHAPNETYRLTSFRKGIRSWLRILAGLAEAKGK